MNAPLTIIIPAYNAERELSGCLESIFAQTRPARVLIANDGSTDRTAEIAEAAAVRSPLVQVLHLPHGGLIATRKASVPKIETPYFAFLDADDRLEPTFVEEMLNAAEKTNADLVFCPYLCVYDGVPRHVSYGGDDAASFRNTLPIQNNPELLLAVPTFFWGKIFRTEFVRPRIEFSPEGCIPLEDIPATVPLLIATPRLTKVTAPLYRYTISSNSMARVAKQELTRITSMRTLHERLEAMGALPKFFPQLAALNRCYLFDQLEKLRGYCDPPHQLRVVREYFRHLNRTLPRWRPHPFHPTFYAAYWYGVVIWNTLKTRLRRAKSAAP